MIKIEVQTRESRMKHYGNRSSFNLWSYYLHFTTHKIAVHHGGEWIGHLKAVDIQKIRAVQKRRSKYESLSSFGHASREIWHDGTEQLFVGCTRITERKADQIWRAYKKWMRKV